MWKWKNWSLCLCIALSVWSYLGEGRVLGVDLAYISSPSLEPTTFALLATLNLVWHVRQWRLRRTRRRGGFLLILDGLNYF